MVFSQFQVRLGSVQYYRRFEGKKSQPSAGVARCYGDVPERFHHKNEQLLGPEIEEASSLSLGCWAVCCWFAMLSITRAGVGNEILQDARC